MWNKGWVVDGREFRLELCSNGVGGSFSALLALWRLRGLLRSSLRKEDSLRGGPFWLRSFTLS